MPPNPTPTPQELKEVLNDFKNNVDIAEFRSSSKKTDKKNIKRSKVINKAMVPVSKTQWVRGRDDEDHYFNVASGGTLLISLPLNEDKAKDKMKKIFKVFRKFIFE